MKNVFLLSLFITSFVIAVILFASRPTVPTEGDVHRPAKILSLCDDSLWTHVYHGRFKTAQDRLQVIEPCKVVTGTIVNAVAEKDGDWHIRLDVADKTLLNQRNIDGQHGYFVLEPVCSNPVSQADTLAEGVCKGFSQNIFNKSMIGKRVQVTGAYVTDVEGATHGWNEIHPVSSIVVFP